ncbi:MAG: hypothetical protein B7Y93_08755 [Micrococcales bacterium 32-70-13]|nr:MAG: hypothetical protein B7Y93_08755 [Micrococcales bacterium 32-70-13]
MLDALLAGVIAGYAIAIPVGAIAALLITLGAQHGARIAAGGAFGAATVDGVYATIAVTAGAVIAPLIAQVEEPLRWVSVAVLAFAASLSWQLLLTTAGSLVGRVLTGPTGARVTALVGGALVIALAVRAALVP